MKSSEYSDPLDMERGHPVSPADVAAQRGLPGGGVTSFADYLAFLASLPPPSREDLERRRGPRGEPFSL